MDTRASRAQWASRDPQARRDLRDHLESPDIRESWAVEGSKAPKGRLVKREKMAFPASTERTERPEFRGSREVLARLVGQDNPGTKEQRDCPGAQAQRVVLESRGRQDPEDMSAWQVLLDLWASQVSLARLAWRESRDQRETEENEDQSEPRESSARLEAREREDRSVYPGPKASLEPKETRVSKEKSEQRETLVTPEWRDSAERRETRVCLGSPDLKASKE